MADKIIGLTPALLAEIQGAIATVKRVVPGSADLHPGPAVASPDDVIVQIPAGGIAAMAGNAITAVDCPAFKITYNPNTGLRTRVALTVPGTSNPHTLSVANVFSYPLPETQYWVTARTASGVRYALVPCSPIFTGFQAYGWPTTLSRYPEADSTPVLWHWPTPLTIPLQAGWTIDPSSAVIFGSPPFEGTGYSRWKCTAAGFYRVQHSFSFFANAVSWLLKQTQSPGVSTDPASPSPAIDWQLMENPYWSILLKCQNQGATFTIADSFVSMPFTTVNDYVPTQVFDEIWYHFSVDDLLWWEVTFYSPGTGTPYVTPYGAISEALASAELLL